MPILENERYELFAQSLAQGKTAQQAYSDAGYKPSRKNAWRLKVNKDIAARVLEIQAAGAKSAEISVASLLAELETARQQATDYKQLSACIRAIEAKARISGLMIERQQIEVTTPEPEPQSINELLAKVCREVSVKAARALAEAFDFEMDERAVMALVNGTEPIRVAGVSQRLIEERRPGVNGRKRRI